MWPDSWLYFRNVCVTFCVGFFVTPADPRRRVGGPGPEPRDNRTNRSLLLRREWARWKGVNQSETRWWAETANERPVLGSGLWAWTNQCTRNPDGNWDDAREKLERSGIPHCASSRQLINCPKNALIRPLPRPMIYGGKYLRGQTFLRQLTLPSLAINRYEEMFCDAKNYKLWEWVCLNL